MTTTRGNGGRTTGAGCCGATASGVAKGTGTSPEWGEAEDVSQGATGRAGEWTRPVGTCRISPPADSAGSSTTADEASAQPTGHRGQPGSWLKHGTSRQPR